MPLGSRKFARASGQEVHVTGKSDRLLAGHSSYIFFRVFHECRHRDLAYFAQQKSHRTAKRQLWISFRGGRTPGPPSCRVHRCRLRTGEAPSRAIKNLSSSRPAKSIPCCFLHEHHKTPKGSGEASASRQESV